MRRIISHLWISKEIPVRERFTMLPTGKVIEITYTLTSKACYT
jgi:hypothetical protein